VKTRIVLLGPPASGKGTQGEMIREKYQIPTPSVGAILRAQAVAGTEIGLAAEKYTSDGLLVPDKMIVELVESWLKENDGAFIFDGFPRTTGQGVALEQLLNKRGTPLQLAVSLEVDFETIQDRVSRRAICGDCGFIASAGLNVESTQSRCPRCHGPLQQRKDDTAEALQRRLVEYHAKSEPLLDFYGERGLLRRIAAQAAPELVFAEISKVLENE
jgi:adenylate kinase